MLLPDLSLARRIEHAESRLCADIAEDLQRSGADALVHRVDSGLAVYCSPGSPMNKLLAVGLAGPLDEEALAEAEQAFSARQAELQAEVCAVAEPAAMAALARRGYTVVGVEHVLARRLDAVEPPQTHECVSVHPITAAERTEWLETVLTGFSHPDGSVSTIENQDFPRDVLERVITDFSRAAGLTRYIATLEGRIAGGATMRVYEGVAQLCGAATLPEHRRRGVQAALFEARLQAARQSGCDVAVVTTQPGSKSQANAMRRGFGIMYGRLIMVRQP